VRVLATIWLIPKMGMDGFFLGWIISWGVEAVYCIIVFFAGGWDKSKEWATMKAATQVEETTVAEENAADGATEKN
jgi:hypothetical protein